MRTELTVIWVLVLLQMVAVTLIVRELRRGGSNAMPRIATKPSEAGELAGGRLEPRALDPISPAPVHGRLQGYLFVLRTCPVCEALLEQMDTDWRQDNPWSLTLVGVGATRSQIEDKFQSHANLLGAGLSHCANNLDVGITTAPWLIVTDSHGRILIDHGAGNLGLVRGTFARANELLAERLGLPSQPSAHSADVI